MNLLNRTAQPFTEEKANEVEVILNADEDDDFTYKVVVAEKVTGPYPAVIEVHDEDGELVALV